MKILSQCALAGVLFSVAQACATPVEISDDIQEVNPDSLGDSGVPGGGQGSGGSAGNDGLGQGGSGQGGASGGGSSGSSGAAGQPGGAGGTLGGGGAAGAPGGAGGAPGGAGGAAGAAGTAGTGGTTATSVFDPAECDFESITGCETFACVNACPAGQGTYCTTACNAIVTCVSETEPLCATEQDPICGARNGGAESECTPEADSAGGATTTDANQPAFKARRFIQCLCSVPRG